MNINHDHIAFFQWRNRRVESGPVEKVDDSVDETDSGHMKRTASELKLMEEVEGQDRMFVYAQDSLKMKKTRHREVGIVI